MSRHSGGVSARTGCPVRADMATIINKPQGITESNVLHSPRDPGSPSAQALARRKNLTKMLAQRLQQEHGSDPVRRALIQGELEACEPLQRGVAFTPAALLELEKNVAKAVAAANGDTRSILPAQTWPRPARAASYAADLSRVSDWTEVNKHRAGFFMLEQQREAAERQRKKETLAVQLAHQKSEVEARRRVRQQEVAREAEQLVALEAEYKKEVAAQEAKKKAKVQKEILARETQSKELRARLAVSTRLRELEDAQTTRELRDEQRRLQEEMARKKVETERYHERTAREYEQNEQRKRDEKLAEQEAAVRLSREATEVLDRKERERTQGIEQLKARIASQQRVYEDKAGALDRARAQAEEENRRRWQERYEREQKAREEARAALRMQGLLAQTASLGQQVELHQEQRRRQRAEERHDAEEIKLAALEFDEAERNKRARHLAAELKNQQALSEQMAEKHSRSPPGKDPMTALDVMLNRDLLLSMALGKAYEPTSVFD